MTKRKTGNCVSIVKSSHLYFYSALYYTDCVKAALQFKQKTSVSLMQTKFNSVVKQL